MRFGVRLLLCQIKKGGAGGNDWREGMEENFPRGDSSIPAFPYRSMNATALPVFGSAYPIFGTPSR
jgi:hypothetical protein